jgi:alpha-beta hydrolase superfamily lysophospholipase
MHEEGAAMSKPSYATHEPALALERRIAEAFGVTLANRPLEVWQAWRGHELHVDRWTPRDPRPLPPVVLVHGGGGNGRVLAPFADAICSAGAPVIAPDLPGYGLTVARPGWRADYAEWVACVADLAGQAGAEHGRPAVLFGLSIGGFVALWAAQLATRVSGVIATTLVDLRDAETLAAIARFRWVGRLAAAAYRTLPGLADAMTFRVTDVAPLDAMSSDGALNAILKRDPLIGRRRVSGRFFRTAFDYVPPAPDLRLACPLLLVHPGADTWTPTTLSKAVFDRVPGRKRFVELSCGSHAPLERPAYDELCAASIGFLHEAATGG